MTLISEYIEAAPAEQKPHLEALYRLAKELLPEASEKISYGIPTFYQHENLLHFAGMQKHLGFYPTPKVIEHFAAQLVSYKTSKGAVQFPYQKPLPESLIRKMILERKKELRLK